jgi:DinB family protein
MTVPSADHKSFHAIADDLKQTIGREYRRLERMTDRDVAAPIAPGKWSRKQIVGHLIDSAANNHQRFVRAQEAALVFPGYAQDHWVDSQRYADRSWTDLIGLWESYNRHLVHVIAAISDDRGDLPCTIGSGAPITLAFLADDYVRHLRHHLAQL